MNRPKNSNADAWAFWFFRFAGYGAQYLGVQIAEAIEEQLATAEEKAKQDFNSDPSADYRFNTGLDFAMERFCHVLGIDPQSVNWDAATETLDGDVCAVIGNILRPKLFTEAEIAHAKEAFIAFMPTSDLHTEISATILKKMEELRE